MRYIFASLIALSVMATLFAFQIPASQAATPPTPTPNIPKVIIELNLQENGVPEYRVTSSITGTTFIPEIVHLPERFHQTYTPTHQPRTKQPPDTEFIDNWELLFSDDFEGTFPHAKCAVFDDSDDDLERFWDDDTYKSYSSTYATWPANGGADGVEPEVSNYPVNMDSWLQCGFFNLDEASKIIVRYKRWLEVNDPDDGLFFGVSVNSSEYQGLRTYGVQDWANVETHVTGTQGGQVWRFISDDDEDRAQGAWIDDLELWQYIAPEQMCGDLDSGRKGITLPEYDPSVGGIAPIIRDGDLTALDHLIESKVDWVRWVFNEENGAVDFQMYDRMVDTLCANNISVLGILNHQRLVRQDFNDPAQADSYRNEFAQIAAFLADYYKDRISHWEIWNEPDYNPTNDLQNPLPPFIESDLYVALLEATYQTIKETDPNATVLYGGQSTAFDGSFNYFQSVYDLFSDKRNPPFDYFTNHPYPDPTQEGVPAEKKSLNPNEYLVFDKPTLLTKFTDRMNIEGAGGKRIWITEIGWNSAESEPNLSCQDVKVVSTQEQADYLTDSFRILFNQAVLADGRTKAVDKVIWYQYMDIGADEAAVCPAGKATKGKGFIATGYIPAGYKQANPDVAAVPWWFGIYNGDKTAPKPSQCAFVAYPFYCGQELEHIYLPAILR